jgi:hypothetical protein
MPRTRRQHGSTLHSPGRLDVPPADRPEELDQENCQDPVDQDHPADEHRREERVAERSSLRGAPIELSAADRLSIVAHGHHPR